MSGKVIGPFHKCVQELNTEDELKEMHFNQPTYSPIPLGLLSVTTNLKYWNLRLSTSFGCLSWRYCENKLMAQMLNVSPKEILSFRFQRPPRSMSLSIYPTLLPFLNDTPHTPYLKFKCLNSPPDPTLQNLFF